MKFLVMSDSHGAKNNIIKAISKEKDVNIIVHLGDGIEEMEEVIKLYPNYNFQLIKGNNDWASSRACSQRIVYSGGMVFLTHGHLFGAKNGRSKLALVGKEAGANVVFYGHTHLPKLEEIAGVTLINPGSINSQISTGSYCVVTLEEDIIKADFKEL